MKAENVVVGETYYVQSKSSCKLCYKVKVLEGLNKSTVLVEGTTVSKKRKKKANPFKLSICQLHRTPDKAVSGYKQHHPEEFVKDKKQK